MEKFWQRFAAAELAKRNNMGNRRKNMLAAMQYMFVFLEKEGRWL